MTYEEKASEIIKNSIKSAIFIDEKARSFFQNDDELTGESEEEISVNLFANFKTSGISLTIHKYLIDDEKNNDLKDYLFEDRDLVLLDWNLHGEEGQEYSLELLSDIVRRPHIHFCTVYTSAKGSDIDTVFRNILSYFSNIKKETLDIFKESLELEEGIMAIRDQLDYININRDNLEVKDKMSLLFRNNKKELDQIIEITGESIPKKAVIIASIALDNTIKTDVLHSEPTLTTFENKTLVIDNTIITILNKQENEPDNLIANISKNITASKSSFTQLLGLEMQSIFSRSSAFIDENLLHFTKEAMIFHRENYKNDGLVHFFPEFIKDILLEKAKLNIRNQSLSLLDDDFLDSLNRGIIPEKDELLAMNTFYNSSKLQTDTKLNFGDVFKDNDSNDYYICITALCDCLRPEKINNAFFFAKGTLINHEAALQLGDTAFLSYLSNEIVVSWTDITSIEDSLHKFSPVYIKPMQFTIDKPDFDENNNLDFNYLGSGNKVVSFNVKYVTTIKTNYTQRIANHAFSHPIRVGVDFVKSTPQKKEGKALWQDLKDKDTKYKQNLGEFEKLDKELVESGVIKPKHSVFGNDLTGRESENPEKKK